MSAPEKDAKFSKACPESAKRLSEQQNNEFSLKQKFADVQFQRGITWRKTKLEAIHEARQSGKSEEWILLSLMRGGVTEATALRMMNDSKRIFQGGGSE